MTLAFPLGLIGLLSLPAILALHLIRQRQRRYVVSDLGLWSFLDQAHRGPRPRRLPLTWLLVLDLTAAALLTLAWTQPQLQVQLPAFQGRQRVILMDVSTSMLARQGLGDRLSMARNEAAALLADAGPRDIITLVTFGRFARSLGDSRQVSLEELSARLQAVQAGETGHALQEAVALGLSAVDGDRPVEFHILTDGAFPEEASAGLEALKHPVRWQLVGDPLDNEAVLEVNATLLDENRIQVFARIANFGSAWSRRQVLLQADGQTIARARLELPAESTVPQVWQVTGEYRSISVTLQGDDVLPEDDSATIGLQPGGEEAVTLVAEQPAPLQQALKSVPGVKLQTILPGDYPSTEGQPPALTVFRGFLPDDLPDGPVLVVEPPEARDPGESELAVSRRASIPAEALLLFPSPDPALAGVDFSGVRWGRAWELPAIPDGFVSLLQASQAPLLLRGYNAGAPLWVLLADLNRGNFTRHPAFPILIANFVLQARGAPLPPSLPAGETLPLPVVGPAGRLQVVAPGGRPADVASSLGAEWTETRRPGLYRVILNSAGQGRQEFLTGVNAGDAEESDLRPRAWTRTAGQEGTLAAGLARPSETRAEKDPPIELAPWLLGAALLVLLLEARLAWR